MEMSTSEEKILKAIEKSRAQLDKEYFRILKMKDGTYVIEQYNGLTLPRSKMNAQGWISMNVFSKYLSKDYPLIDINDFYAKDGLTIEKKSDREVLLDKIEIYKEWLSEDLKKGIKEMLVLLEKLGLNFLEYTDFNSLVKSVQKIVQMSTLAKDVKASIMVDLSLTVNSIFAALDSLNFDKLRKTFNDDYKLFFVVVAK